MSYRDQSAQLCVWSDILREEQGPHLETRSNVRGRKVGDEGVQRRSKQQRMFTPGRPVQRVRGIGRGLRVSSWAIVDGLRRANLDGLVVIVFGGLVSGRVNVWPGAYAGLTAPICYCSRRLRLLDLVLRDGERVPPARHCGKENDHAEQKPPGQVCRNTVDQRLQRMDSATEATVPLRGLSLYSLGAHTHQYEYGLYGTRVRPLAGTVGALPPDKLMHGRHCAWE